MFTLSSARRLSRRTSSATSRRVLAAVGVATVASLSAAASAGAAVSSTTGAAQIVSAPASVAVGAYESSTNVRVFTEAQLTLTTTLTTWMPGATGTMTQLPPIVAGVCVQSHMLHMDAVGAATPTLSGSATFSQNIVGVIPINTNLPLIGRPLDASDALFAVAGTTYPTAGNTGRGFDLLTVDSLGYNVAQPRTLSFTFGGDGFDEVRVLTVCDPPANVPEAPLNVLLPVAGLAVVVGGGLLYRRKTRLA